MGEAYNWVVSICLNFTKLKTRYPSDCRPNLSIETGKDGHSTASDGLCCRQSDHRRSICPPPASLRRQAIHQYLGSEQQWCRLHQFSLCTIQRRRYNTYGHFSDGQSYGWQYVAHCSRNGRRDSFTVGGSGGRGLSQGGYNPRRLQLHNEVPRQQRLPVRQIHGHVGWQR